jgi:GIY-YIG catalytic domain
MGHIQDLWITASGQPSSRHGHGKRWRARWTGTDGMEHSKNFTRRVDADQYLIMREKAKVRTELLAADGDGIDPAGYYVYLLWEVQGDTVPVYVGSSGNILNRLGSHLGDNAKRAQVGWVTLIRCTSQQAMLRRETGLIRKYRPAWNRHIPGGAAERIAQAPAPECSVCGAHMPGASIRRRYCSPACQVRAHYRRALEARRGADGGQGRAAS